MIILNPLNAEETVNLAREIYRGSVRCSRSAKDYAKQFEHNELTDCGIPIYDDRKARAAINTLPKVRKIFQDTDKNIAEKIYIEEDWFCANAILSESLDMQNENYNFALGATIWILDELEKAGELKPGSETISTIVEIAKSLDVQVYIPDFWDMTHGQDLVTYVLAILSYRNQECNMDTMTQNVVAQYPGVEFNRFFGDLATVKHQQDQSALSRVFFNRLLDLIPESSKKAAVKKFEDLIWDATERYIKCRCVYAKDEIEIPKKLNRLQKQCNDLYANPDSTICHPSAVLANPIIQRKPIYTTRARTEFSTKRYEDIDRLRREIKKAQEQNDLAIQHISLLWFSLVNLPLLSGEGVKSIFDETVYEMWKDFKIDNPYELCFAALYLIDQDSDLVWLRQPCGILMNFVGTALPWIVNEETEDDGFSKRNLKDCLETPYKIQFKSASGRPYNWVQIVYQLTGSIWPREISETRIADINRDLKLYNIDTLTSDSDMLRLLDCMMRGHTLGKIAMQQNDSSSKIEEVQPQNDSEITELRDEIERLKQQLYKADKNVQALNEKQENIIAERDSEKKELVALREWMFQQQLGEDTSEENSNAVEFPLHTDSLKVVSYGGHPSWLTAIRQFLPDVKFYDANVVPNKELMANADAIWIQPNCIGHPQYYKIMSVVKLSKNPLHYFRYASAKLCALQLVKDLNLK